MYYLVGILFAVGWIQAAIIRNFNISKSPISNKYLNHGTKSVPIQSVLGKKSKIYTFYSTTLFFTINSL